MNTPVVPAAASRATMRLALCFDGTWNDPEDHTNVSRIFSAIADVHSGCHRQLKFYDAGVGTEVGNRIRGGASGRGLDTNVLQGYSWLVQQYEQGADGEVLTEADGQKFRKGDEIYLFGFSRGAFTARSLGGLINRCGIVKRSRIAEHRSKTALGPGHPLIRHAWDLYRKAGQRRDSPEARTFRQQNAWDVKIRFIGVWDTVGALGIPFIKKIFAPLQARHQFHDTKLGRVVEHAYQAIAIDEHRKDFDVALWTGTDHQQWNAKVEQRWFPGAHSNVGGGYEDDLLPDPSLYWMSCKARDCGLEFSRKLMPAKPTDVTCSTEVPKDFELQGNEYLGNVRDSYEEMAFGVYRVLTSRHYRQMLVKGCNECIDESAHLKWANDPRYRPRNFSSAGRTDFTP
jgi:uncharacterized protein (DUF2235 family)